SIGYATSSDGIAWSKYPTPVFSGHAAIDVEKWRGVYFMLLQGAWEGTLLATSKDGISWQSQSAFVSPVAGDPTKIIGHITPFLFIGPSGKPDAVYMGGGLPDGTNGYDKNAIYMYRLNGA